MTANYLILSWADFEKKMCLLAHRITKIDFSPDVLFTPLWNGAILAKYLSYFLNVPQIEGMYVSYYAGINKKKTQVDIQPISPLSLQGKKVLLIDDISDTGNTLKEMVKALNKQEVLEYRSATLFVKPHSVFFPDVYVEKTEKWVVFPWEYPELLRDFALEKFGELTEETLLQTKKLLKLSSSIHLTCLREKKKLSKI